MSGMNYSAAVRTAQAQALIDALDADASPGRLEFYTLPYPASLGEAITTQTLLGTCTFSKPCGTASGGVLTFAAIADDELADADGIAAWCRATDGAGNWVADLRVTLALIDDPNNPGQTIPGAGPVLMPVTQIYAGGVIRVTSASITMGNASILTAP